MILKYSKAVEMAVGVKLNYVIPELLDDALAKYCDQTGRSASDVIRQLLSEFIDGDRKLSSPAREAPNGVRSNMLIPARTLDALENKIATEGHGTKGGIIARLLYDFLEHRMGDSFGETITVTLDRPLFKKLYERSTQANKSIEDVIVEACNVLTKGAK